MAVSGSTKIPCPSLAEYLGCWLARHLLQQFIKMGSITLGIPARLVQGWQSLLLLIIL